MMQLVKASVFLALLIFAAGGIVALLRIFMRARVPRSTQKEM